MFFKCPTLCRIFIQFRHFSANGYLSELFLLFNTTEKVIHLLTKQDSIPAGCILSAWKPYILQFQLPLLDVAWGGGGGEARSSNEQV